MAADTPWRKKLIEVAIPLDAINRESAREKSIRHGHPSTLHLWWARRPLAACRAVIFCSLIDDPGEEGAPAELLRQIDALPEPSTLPADWDVMDLAERRRQKLFEFVETLVKWESTTDESVIGRARELILAATEGNPPPLLDPFCGGGSIPLEAQRLGLEAHGSDLNPVAVLITKALIELPPKFAGMPPVNPDARGKLGSDAEWKGAAGLAEDVRWYGEWMRQRAWERIGHLYPQGPNGETVIAWLWARTVECPNPACRIRMPLVKSFWLSRKRRRIWLEPIADGKAMRFDIRDSGKPTEDGTVNRQGTKCVRCGTAASFKHVRKQAQRIGLGVQLMAVVEEGYRQRVYRAATSGDYTVAHVPAPTNVPDAALPHNPRNFQTPIYGMTHYNDLFTPRQLTALTVFSDLVAEVQELVRMHAEASERPAAYVSAVATYLGIAVDRLTDRGCTLATWDFAETNFFSDSTGSWRGAVSWITKVLQHLPVDCQPGFARQLDATATIAAEANTSVISDPPYYDNIVYADVSDFYYVWMRRTLRDVYPDEFATMVTPKAQELVATQYRFEGGRDAARKHFERGLASTLDLVRNRVPASVPTGFFYAYKQTEQSAEDGSATSPGWETMLASLIQSGFAITATWPTRTEMANRLIASGANALATSVVVVCRPRPDDAPMADIGEFNRALASELPAALNRFIGEHIAPVDLPQASIGPGMAVFSRYSAVVLPNGERMSVRRALELINEGVEQFFSEREGAFDAPTQFCLRWFEQFGFEDGPFGDADNMARAKDISVEELDREGVLTAQRGKVRLIPFERYEASWESWEPSAARRLSAWRVCHYLAAALEHGGVHGDQHDAGGAARLAHELGGNGEPAKELAYRLYAICDAKGWTQEARRYNALADAWPEISAEAARLRQAQQGQLGVN